MHDEYAGADRKDGLRPDVAQTSATVVRRGIMFVLAHSVFLALAVSLFAAD
jgi:hypothetical protein